MSQFEHFVKVLSLYLEARIWIWNRSGLKVKGRIIKKKKKKKKKKKIKKKKKKKKKKDPDQDPQH